MGRHSGASQCDGGEGELQKLHGIAPFFER
jgi:hypothetical protein